MDQTLPYYFMLAVFTVLVRYGTGEIHCNHSCQIDRTCNHQQINDTCYYIFKDKVRNWFNSRQFCDNQGFSMVKLTQDKIYNFSGLFRDLPGGLFSGHDSRTSAWLGGRAFNLIAWTFLNNIKAFRAGLLLPSNSDIEHTQCGTIYKHSNKFEIQFYRCGSPLPFICRLEKDNWHVVLEKKSWFEARSDCIGLGGDLFYLDNNETLNLFETNERLAKITEYHHIGLRHRVWEWIDGLEINSTNWEANEPNTFSENCLLLYGDNGKWNDNDCYEDKLTFCQTVDKDAASQVVQAENTDIAIIILGSLLGVFFITTISLIMFIVCTKCSCKSANGETEIIENHYYSSSSEHEYGQSLATSSNGTSFTSPSSHDSTVEYSYDASTAKKTHIGGSDFTINKPVIKPKPIIGPKTGDVYSSIDKRSCLPVKPQDTCLYVNTD